MYAIEHYTRGLTAKPLYYNKFIEIDLIRPRYSLG